MPGLPSGADVVSRLRATFALIVTVLIVMLLAARWQVETARNAAQHLSDEAIPTLVQTQDIERELKELLLLLQAADAAEDVEALQDVRGKFDERLAAFGRRIAPYSPDGVTSDAYAHISQVIDQMADNSARKFQIKQQIFESYGRLRQRLQTIEALQIELRDTLEQTSLKLAVELERLLIDQPSVGRIDTTQIETRVVAMSTVAELSFRGEALVDQAGRLPLLIGDPQMDRTKNALMFNLRGIAQLLVQLPDAATRSRLAQEIRQLRSLVLGPQGVMTELDTLARLTQDIEAYRATEIAVITTISEMADALLEKAQSDILAAKSKLAKANQRTDSILIVAVLATVLVIGVVTFAVVDRQINRRMAALTEAVLRIADGDTTHEVAIDGQDELGRMADALQVFKRNAEELRRSNEELERFAYAAAHDLRSPLGAIRDLAEWTIEDAGDELSSECRANLNMLLARADRLSVLLGDLLDYARVGQDGVEQTAVIPSQLVMNVADLLSVNPFFTVSYYGFDEPLLMADAPLKQILINLVGNAVKHHDKSTGHVSITMHLASERAHFAVEDDGPGIPPKYHDRIFGLFQTLRPRDEVEGSGLGLALIRKIVEHSGGAVVVRSNPDVRRGTRFEFDLPYKPCPAAALSAA